MAFPEFIEFPHTGFGAGRLIGAASFTIITSSAVLADFIEFPHTGAGAG